MTDRSPKDIEREIEAERSALESSIEQLQQQFTPEMIVEQATSFLQSNGGELAHKAKATVQDNPLACAMVAGGVAWLLAGSGGSAKPVAQLPPPAPAPAPKPAYDSRSRPTAQGFASRTPPMAGFDDRLAAAGDELRANGAYDPAIKTQSTPHPEDVEMSTYHPDSTLSQNSSWSDETQGYAARAKAQVSSTAEKLKARISDGTAGMSEEARARVLRARSAAISAQAKMEAHAAEAARQARQTARNRPLMVGALAFAAGAALAAALPRTQTENRALGGHRDRLMDEADRVFREESSKLKAVAQAAVAETQTIAKEALDGDSDTPSAGDAVKRVSRAAKSKASAKNVGSSVN